MRRAALALVFGLAACGTGAEAPRGVPACPAAGGWLLPASGEQPPHQDLLAGLAERSAVLLGESHDQAEHHRWQLQVLAGLYTLRPNLVLGAEAFPRDVQPALDRWSAGELDEAAFLSEARWREVWAIDPELYLPLFHFARMNRIPLVALNVDRALVRRVAEAGWDGVPEAERAGLSRPAPASAAYLEILAEAYRAHLEMQGTEAGETEVPETIDIDDPDFRSFVDAQLVWDRAMAEAILAARKRPEMPLVVGIIGRGHLQYGHGVSWQLADLGLAESAVLLPYETGPDCDPPDAELADAVFGLAYEEPAPAARPRLGVRIEAAETEGVRVLDVAPDSVGAAAGLKSGDVIEAAAGLPVAAPAALIEIIARQAPGTWLPLTVRRGAEVLEVVARFPPAH